MPILKTALFVYVLLFCWNDGIAQFRVADPHKDKWARDDKAAHLFGNYFAIDLTRQWMSDKAAIPLLLTAGVLWEVKDGFVPYEKYGFWGGEGFSTKDVVAGAVGIGLNYVVHGILDRDDPITRDKRARERISSLRKQKDLRALAQ
jgi:hypothetical protein